MNLIKACVSETLVVCLWIVVVKQFPGPYQDSTSKVARRSYYRRSIWYKCHYGYMHHRPGWHDVLVSTVEIRSTWWVTTDTQALQDNIDQKIRNNRVSCAVGVVNNITKR